jgi:pimeloyl-ACP methyl ester carboxylesterase
MKNLRKYGSKPFRVAVLHGGPGAPGEMAPVARELSSVIGILEPMQTAASLEGQVQELKDVLKRNATLPISLIGFSWGAWLGFICAARYPSLVRKLILIGSGPYEEEYAMHIVETRLRRLTEGERDEVPSLLKAFDDPSVKDKSMFMGRLGELMSRADSYDPLPHANEILEWQYNIYHNVWREAAELRRNRNLLELGKKIECSVVAIHGDHDPHPAEGVRNPLSRVLKDFRFILLEKCGHYPWYERQAKDRFFTILRDEIVR